MTSTPYNVGLDLNERPSSRVLRPPGGGHTDIFGGEPEPPRTGRRQQPAILEQNESTKPTNGTGSAAAEQNGQAAETAATPVDVPANVAPANNAPVENSKTETAMLAPQPPAPASQPPAPASQPPAPVLTPTKRVRVPPGGFSTPLW